MAAFLFLFFGGFAIGGCATSHPPRPLVAATQQVPNPDFVSQYVESIDAHAMPPAGWKPDPLKSSATHAHLVWLSPSGHTAYGIIHFKLPIPVGHELALFGFLQNMKMREGEATLLSKQWDANKKMLRFVVVGGLYTVRCNLFVDGLTGWAVYAGTLRNEKIEANELALAEQARELTTIGQ